MDPIVASDAQPAGSSPAVDLVAPSQADPLDSLSGKELQTWRETGEMPTASPVTAPPAASPAATPVEGQAASTDANPQPAASEPAATPGADKRIPELLADRAKERARGDRLERELAALRRPAQPSPDARPAASSAAPAGPVAPNPESFTYGTADPGYLAALTQFEVAKTLAAERATWEQGQRDARSREEGQRVITAFEEKAAAARTKHADFDAVALLAPTEIPAGSAVDLFILEAPAGAELLYHLQQPAHVGELKRLLALGPLQQLSELVRLGDRLTAETPAPASTTAPPPPPTLATRATPADAAERAIAEDDMATYIAVENARDLAARKR